MDTADIGRTLVIVGVAVAIVGALLVFGLPIGRLPGDITLRGDNWSVYIPIATGVVLSIGLTLVFALAAALQRR